MEVVSTFFFTTKGGKAISLCQWILLILIQFFEKQKHRYGWDWERTHILKIHTFLTLQDNRKREKINHKWESRKGWISIEKIVPEICDRNKRVEHWSWKLILHLWNQLKRYFI